MKPTLEKWHACLRTGNDWTREHRVKGRDGAWRTILSLGRPVRDAQGRIISWVGFNLDISARKEAEDALRESEARFRGTFDNAAVGMANVGLDGLFLQVNDRLCDRRLRPEEMIAMKFQQITHPDDLQAHLDQRVAMQRGEIAAYTMEQRFICKGGSVV